VNFNQGELNELALFGGAGGGILGGKLLGWRTVCAVEWEPYPACVLGARQNDGILPPFPMWVEWLMGWPLGWTDLKPLAMDRFQSWQQQHLEFYQEQQSND
jgi:site-specific DNA-cytosine methylase